MFEDVQLSSELCAKRLRVAREQWIEAPSQGTVDLGRVDEPQRWDASLQLDASQRADWVRTQGWVYLRNRLGTAWSRQREGPRLEATRLHLGSFAPGDYELRIGEHEWTPSHRIAFRMHANGRVQQLSPR